MPLSTTTVAPVPTRTRWGRLSVLTGPRHGHLWTPAEEQRQPQDGAIDLDTASDEGAFTLGSLYHREPRDLREPEDARLTGGTRSLMRRVLGLNVTRPALSPAGARATDSVSRPCNSSLPFRRLA